MLHWKIIVFGCTTLAFVLGSFMIFLHQFTACTVKNSIPYCTIFWKFYW